MYIQKFIIVPNIKIEKPVFESTVKKLEPKGLNNIWVSYDMKLYNDRYELSKEHRKNKTVILLDKIKQIVINDIDNILIVYFFSDAIQYKFEDINTCVSWKKLLNKK